MRLGELLVSRSKISPQQLEDALVHQKYFPGKTGTHLVELGFVPLNDLEQVLSEHFDSPQAPDSDLEGRGDFLLAEFPAEVTHPLQLLPFKRTGHILHVAMTNPRDSRALSWLQQTTHGEVRVYFLSEIRYHYFLFRYHPKGSNARIRNLFFEILKSRHRRKQSATHSPQRSGLYVDPVQREALGIKPLEKGEELSQEGDEQFLYPPLPKDEMIPPPELLLPKPYEPEFAQIPDLGKL